jgi:hypothetical protein
MQDLMRKMMTKRCHDRVSIHDIVHHPWVTLDGTLPLYTEDDLVRMEGNEIFLCHVLVVDNDFTCRHSIGTYCIIDMR